MLTKYIQAAMKHAAYEQLPDGTWFGHVEPLQGVWAAEASRSAGEEELQSVLEDWIVFRLTNGFPIPAVAGLTLTAAKVA